MSTQINITIGDQRLLQQNKTRAAANQQALDDRTATKNTKAAATEQAFAQQEEPPGAVPENVIKRRPAAQRKKAADFVLYEMNALQLIVEPNSTQIFSQEWTGYRSIAYYGNSPPYALSYYTIYDSTRYNNYNIDTKSILPLFEQQQAAQKVSWAGEKHYQYNNVNSIDWTLRQRSREWTGVPSVEATPPTLPFKFEDKIYNSQIYNPVLISCDTVNIYVAARLLHFVPAGAILRVAGNTKSIYDSTAYELDNTLTPLSFGYGLRRRDFQLQTTLVWTHLYWTFNTKTKTVSFYKNGLFDSTTGQSAASFLNGLTFENPQYKMWTAYKQEFSNLSDTTLAPQYLYSLPAPYKRWPRGLGYNPTTGLVTITTRTFQNYYYRLFTYTVAPATNHTVVAALLPSNYDQDNMSATTDKDFTDAGWTLTKEFDSTLPVSDYYFAMQS